MTTAPDVVLLGAEWPERALVRAQLLEEGYEVVATDRWPIPRQFLRAETKPRVLVVDLRGLAEPNATLEEIAGVMPAHRVVVVTALGTITTADIRRLGFHVVARPASIRELVATVADVLRFERIHEPDTRS